MTPYYQDDWVTIYHGDCRELVAHVRADAAITDPPYGVNIADWDTEVPYDVLPHLTPLGVVVWFGSSSRITEDVIALRPERTMVWAPKFRLGSSAANGIAYRFHPIYCWNLPSTHEGPVWDVLSDMTGGHKWWNHPGTKPLPLMRRLVGLAPSGGTVLDPFMGSGTTLRAAKDTNRRAIGIEIEERYCEIAAKRCAQEVLPLAAGWAAPE